MNYRGFPRPVQGAVLTVAATVNTISRLSVRVCHIVLDRLTKHPQGYFA